MEIYKKILLLTILTMLTYRVYSQTPGQQFCFCKFEAPSGYSRLSLGMLYNIDFHKKAPPTSYLSVNMIQDINIKKNFGIFIIGGINWSDNKGNNNFKLKENLDPFRGLNLSIAGYYLWKISNFTGAYLYPEISGKSNTFYDRFDQNIILLYQLSFGINAEFMIKPTEFIPFPLTVSARVSEILFSPNKYSMITGESKTHLESMELSLGSNLFQWQLTSFSLNISTMFAKKQNPYYRLGVALYIPRMDLLVETLNELF